jgi:poly-gamma-glutamate capsule biosynthesis protein CapA/YwtB (metallophosphatase superfamily)
MPTVLIGADICPIEENAPYFAKGDAANLFHDLLLEFEQADIVIANLECPLIRESSPILKTGPTFGEPGDRINGIKAAGIDVLCLANNHILDHGAAGLKNTIEVCKQAGIDTVGAGDNLAAARRILVKQTGNLRIGILAVAEYEFSIATKNSWGANPLDLIDYVRNVQEQRHNFDYLIVLVHGSAEFHVPTPRLQETCRFMIEMGANAVIVQHPHVVGGYEHYRNGHIVYGQGALLMDEAIYRKQASFHESYLMKLIVADDATSRMEIIPFVQSEPAPGARKMSAEREEKFLAGLEQKARAVTDRAAVEAAWLKFCEKKQHSYISGLLGHNRVLRKLNSRGWLTRLLYSPRQLLGARNIVCCETHREAVDTIFNQLKR